MITKQLLRIFWYAILLLGTAWNVHAQLGQSESPDVIDARRWDFSERLPLKGTWKFFENQLISPDRVNTQTGSRYLSFPALWNDQREDGKGVGYATYSLTIILPDSLEKMALEIPQMYSSYSLWVNSELLTTSGHVSEEKETATPQWIYKTVSFSAVSDTVSVVLQLANFHHYKGGAIDPIYLGTEAKINSHFNWAMGSNVVEASVLFLEGVFFLLFYRSKRKTVILYFALLCITWSLRSVFSNLYPVVSAFPDFNWQLLVKIEYLTLYLMAIWAALFFHALFTDISNEIFTFLPVTLNLFFIAFTIATPVIFFSRWISLYLGVEFLVILYGAKMIIRSLIVDREGSGFLLASLSVGVLIFGYDIAAYQTSFTYNAVILNVGHLLIFLLTTVALLLHLGIIGKKTKRKDRLSYADLFEKK